jgi:cytochrome c
MLFIIVERGRPDLTCVNHISYYCSQSGTWRSPWNFGSEVPCAHFLEQGAKMKSTILAGLAVAGFLAAGLANASEDLAKKAGCTLCHATDQKKVGPAFKDIAARNKGKAGAEAILVAKVKGGKPHPPVKASDDEVKKIVKWVLAM